MTERYKLTNSAVIVVGDFGVGFESKAYFDQIYNKYSHRLEKNNNMIYMSAKLAKNNIYYM